MTRPKGSGRWRSSSKSGTRRPIVTLAEAAKEAGVSKSGVSAARRLRRTAAPEVVQAVEAGKLTLHAAEAMS